MSAGKVDAAAIAAVARSCSLWSCSETAAKTATGAADRSLVAVVHDAERTVGVGGRGSFESRQVDSVSSSRQSHHPASELAALIQTFGPAVAALLHYSSSFTVMAHLSSFAWNLPTLSSHHCCPG